MTLTGYYTHIDKITVGLNKWQSLELAIYKKELISIFKILKKFFIDELTPQHLLSIFNVICDYDASDYYELFEKYYWCRTYPRIQYIIKYASFQIFTQYGKELICSDMRNVSIKYGSLLTIMIREKKERVKFCKKLGLQFN